MAVPKSESSAPIAESSSAAAELKTHQVAGGTLSFAAPATWSLKRLDLLEGQLPRPTAENLLVLDANGKTMAEFRTSFEPVLDDGFDPAAPVFPYQVIEQHQSSVKHSLPEDYKDNRFAFEALGSGAEIQGLLAIGLEPYAAAEELQGLYTSAVNGEDGLFFAHRIEPKAVLPGVDKSLSGVEKFKAYQQSDEYNALKSMMLSLKQTGKTAATKQAATNEPCLGASYAYDLMDSGLSCSEAKSFVQKLHDEGGRGAGGFDLRGFGGCYDLPHTQRQEDNDSMMCQSEDSKIEFKIRFRG